MIRREASIFLVVGCLTVLVDFLTYRSLLWSGFPDVGLAKAISFITGTIFAYFANRLWTFGHKRHAPGSILRFAMLYALTLGINVLVNHLVLLTMTDFPYRITFAFLMATGTSAVLNFIGMKFFVFRSAPEIVS